MYLSIRENSTGIEITRNQIESYKWMLLLGLSLALSSIGVPWLGFNQQTTIKYIFIYWSSLNIWGTVEIAAVPTLLNLGNSISVIQIDSGAEFRSIKEVMSFVGMFITSSFIPCSICLAFGLFIDSLLFVWLGLFLSGNLQKLFSRRISSLYRYSGMYLLWREMKENPQSWLIMVPIGILPEFLLVFAFIAGNNTLVCSGIDPQTLDRYIVEQKEEFSRKYQWMSEYAVNTPLSI